MMITDSNLVLQQVAKGSWIAIEPGTTKNDGRVFAWTPTRLVVKWPAGTHWVADCTPREYHPAEFVVYEVVSRKPNASAATDWANGVALRVRYLIAWDAARSPRPVRDPELRTAGAKT